MRKILPFFSYFFHPVFIPVFAVLFYFFNTTDYYNYKTIYIYTIYTLVVTVFIPLLVFYLLMALNKIDTIMVADVEQRKIPLLLQILLFGIIVNTIFPPTISYELFYFFLGSICSGLLALLLTFYRKKISLHMVGIASLTVFCIGCLIHFETKNVYFIALLLLCNGLVASSRLELKAHSSVELISGYCIGLVPQFFLLFLWL